jgi:hypothetical protein
MLGSSRVGEPTIVSAERTRAALAGGRTAAREGAFLHTTLAAARPERPITRAR